jgi:hypothetical protein
MLLSLFSIYTSFFPFTLLFSIYTFLFILMQTYVLINSSLSNFNNGELFSSAIFQATIGQELPPQFLRYKVFSLEKFLALEFLSLEKQ